MAEECGREMVTPNSRHGTAFKHHAFDCHPEEPTAVLSETKERSPQFVEATTAEILRFAQNDKVHGYLRSLLNPIDAARDASAQARRFLRVFSGSQLFSQQAKLFGTQAMAF
jgi:hypothetical protein